MRKLFISFIVLSLTVASCTVSDLNERIDERYYKKLLKKAEREDRKDNNAEAMEIYEEVFNKYPFHYVALIKYANILFEDHKYDLALSKYEKAKKELNKSFITLLDKGINNKHDKKLIDEFRDKMNSVDNKIKSCQAMIEELRVQDNLRNKNNFDKEVKINDQYSENNAPKSLAQGRNFKKLEGETDDEKLKFLQDRVIDYFDSLKNDPNWKPKGIKEIIEINQDWWNSLKFEPLNWFDKLKDKENFFRNRLNEYNDYLRDNIRLVNDTKIIRNEIVGIQNKINFRKDEIDYYDKIINEVLPSEKDSRLETIPRSIVLIGKIILKKNQDQDSLLIRKMCNAAIEQINKPTGSSTTYRVNDNFQSLDEKTKSGIAEVRDKFYMPINDEENFKTYSYKILRIEVYKSNIKINDNPEKNNKDSNDECSIYEIIKSNDGDWDYRLLLGYDDIDYDFSKEAKEFIKEVLTTSNGMNNEYEDKEEEANNNFHENKKDNEDTLKLKRTSLNSLEQQLYDKNNELNKLNNRHSEIENKIIRWDSAINKAQKEYEDFYSQKPQYSNHLAIRPLFESGFDISSELYKDLAKKCFNSILDLIRKETKTTIFRKKQNENNTTYDINTYTVNYKPSIDSFQIISLGKESMYSRKYYNLNIAFKITWEGQKPVKDATESTLPELTHNIPYGSYENQVDWRLANETSTDLYTYYDSLKKNGWTLPAKEVLKNILMNENNRDTLKNKLVVSGSWPTGFETIVFVSEDTRRELFDNQGKNVAFKVNSNWDIEEITVDMGDSVYIIEVKSDD